MSERRISFSVLLLLLLFCSILIYFWGELEAFTSKIKLLFNILGVTTNFMSYTGELKLLIGNKLIYSGS